MWLLTSTLLYVWQASRKCNGMKSGAYHIFGNDSTNVIRQKSLGAAIMVSDFVDDINGFVRDEVQEARLSLETQKEGYFNNDHLLEQVEYTINIFEWVHPQAKGLFLFDNARKCR